MIEHDRDFDLPPQATKGLMDHVSEAVEQARAARRPATPEPPPIPGIEQARKAAERRRLAHLWASIVPPQFHEARLIDLDRCRQHTGGHEAACTDCADLVRVRELATGWSESGIGDRANLLIGGPTGSGKTHAGFAAARAPFASGVRLDFRPSVELLADLDWKAEGSREALHRASTVPLLYVDDLGAERSTDWAQEQWYTIVNRRWLDGLPMIVTTNLAPDDLRAHLGADGRTYDRLRDRVVGINIGGTSRRGNP